jgi:hypothetical protein
MNECNMGKSTVQVVDLLLQHDPSASDEQIAGVVSEWGHLLFERSEYKSAHSEASLGLTDWE